MKYLIDEPYIKVWLGKGNSPTPFAEAFTTVLYNFMYKLPKGFYLPEGYIVLPPGVEIYVSVSSGYQKKVYIYDVETGSRHEKRELKEISNFQVPLKVNLEQKTIEPPYDLIIVVFDERGNPLGEYVLHIRNYAVPVFIQAFMFLYYLYIPLYSWYLKQLGFSPVSIQSALEDEVGKFLALPLEDFPTYYGSDIAFGISDYYQFSNPLETILPDINLAQSMWNMIQELSWSLDEKFSYLFNFSMLYGQYRIAVSTSSPVVAVKYLSELLKHILTLLQSYYESTAIQGFGMTIVPKVSIPQFFMLPFDGGNNTSPSVNIPATWNFVKASYTDSSFVEDSGKLTVYLPVVQGNFVVYRTKGSSGLETRTLNIAANLEVRDLYGLVYNFGYSFPVNVTGDMQETDFVYAFYPDNNSGLPERIVFFPNLVTYVNYKDDFYGIVSPVSSGEIKIVPLYPNQFKLGDNSSPFFDDDFAGNRHDLPFEYFENKGISLLSLKQNSVLFKNSGDSGEGSQFMLADMDVAGLQWVLIIHLYLKQNYRFTGNPRTADRNLLSSFLSFIDLFSRDFFGMVEVWITPYKVVGTSGNTYQVQFDDSLYNDTCDSSRPKNMCLFWGLPLKEWLNVWS